jgi:hypothetical protein
MAGKKSNKHKRRHNENENENEKKNRFWKCFYYYSIQCLRPYRVLSSTLKMNVYKIIILPVVSYEPETIYLTLREEHNLQSVEK